MSKNTFRLKFDSPTVEQEFIQHYHGKSLWQARLALLMGVGLFGSYGYLDTYIIPDTVITAWIIRLVVCSIILISFALTYVHRLQKHFQLITCLPGAITGLSLLIIIGFAGMEAGAYYVGLLVIIVWIGNFSTTRFFASFIACMAILFGFYWVFTVHVNIPGFLLLDHSYFMFTILFISLFSNYSLEASNRREFLSNREREISMEAKVAERKKAEEAIRASEEKSRLLLQSVGEGIFGVDLDGKVAFMNPAANQMLGYGPEELIGKEIHEKIHHSHADGSAYPKSECPMYLTRADGTDHHIADEVLWRKDGSSFPVEYTSMPIKKDEQVVGAVVTFMDITERKRAEEMLKESEETLREQTIQFRTIFKKSPVGILHFGKDGIVLDCNDRHAELMGSTRKKNYWNEFMEGK
jgi:PAS domain S-box-containing protein